MKKTTTDSVVTNSSLGDIGDRLRKADSILIFPHVNPDGDAIGSSSALCQALINMGKEAWVVLEEGFPEFIEFLDGGHFVQPDNCAREADICVCVDCSDEGRINKRLDLYRSGRQRICIDHHLTPEGFGEDGFCDYYYVDSGEAACSQIIYKLLMEMKCTITSSMAEALYTGIVTDTGSFQYSNTTPLTHRIAAKLIECGIDHMKITTALYQNISRSKLAMEMKILDTMQIIGDGMGAVAFATQEMADAAGGSMDDAEGVIDIIRNIEGVEIAAVAKERDGAIKASLRAKSWAGVDEIASRFGGGGHRKAAGCTLDMSVKQAVDVLKQAIEEYLEKELHGRNTHNQ